MRFLLDFYFKAREQIASILGLNFGQIHYSDARTSVYIGLFLIFVLLARISFPVIRKRIGKIINKFAWESSGEQADSQQGVIFKLFLLVPKIIFGIGVGLLLAALSEPFLSVAKEEKKVLEGRVRVDLRDISGSMESWFPGTKKSKGEIAAQAHAEFVKMRQGQNDRVSLWLFASIPHMVEDFIVDDEVYYRQVVDAPWLTGYSNSTLDVRFKDPDFYIPRERFAVIDEESGGTALADAFQAVINQFDHDRASIGKNGRSVLIVTDGEPDRYPGEQLQGLKRRKIIPYIIFIRSIPPSPDEYESSYRSIVQGQASASDTTLPEVVSRIGEYGGKYFDARDENGLKRAYQEIDKLEKVKFEIKNTLIKIPLFQSFIFAGMVFIGFGTILGLALGLLREYPD